MPKLIGTDGTHFYAWPLKPGKYSLGRNTECDFCIPDQTVSRKHAEIELDQSGKELYLTDLKSHNGTTVNGKLLTSRTAVHPGDHILFGKTEFKFELEGEGGITRSSMRSATLMDLDPEQSMVLSMQEALKPLPKRISDIPELLPTLFDMASVLVLPEPRESMLQKALALVAKVIPAERLAVLFVSESQDEVLTAATLLPSGKDPGAFTLSRTIIKELLSNRNAILVGNPLDDPRFASQQSIIASSLKSAMAVPLLDEDRVLGVLYVDTKNPLHRYSDEYLRLLATFGNIITSRLVNFGLLQERELKQAMEVELRRASSIQQNLLIKNMPELPGYGLHAFQLQSRSVGGDLYDATILPDGRLLFLAADVSGKGMGAALLMSNILASFRILYHDQPFDLVQAVSQVSLQLCRYSAPEDFATLFIGILDGPTGTLTYVNAGHNPPLIVRASREIEHLEPCGIMIGAFNFADWTESKAKMAPGDLLFLFTDGVTEAMKGDEQYTDERMERFVVASHTLAPVELADALMHDIATFVGDGPRSDDITMLIIKRELAC